jgi:hypothetical protein
MVGGNDIVLQAGQPGDHRCEIRAAQRKSALGLRQRK